MSNDGFLRADVDTGYFSDDKVKALWRRLASPTPMAMAVTLHVATVLGSWQAGRRLTVDEASPDWLIPPDEIVAAMISVGLLDRYRRLPAQTWAAWIEPAVSRRGQARAAGAIGNQKRWGARQDAEIGGAIADAMALRVAPRSRGESRRDRPTNQPTNHTTTQPTNPPSRKGTSNARPRASRGAARGGLTSLADAIEGTPFAAEHARRAGGE